MTGVEWDLEDGGYVRLVAISAAGESVREVPDPATLQALLRIYSDSTERDIFRGAAYSAMMRAAGKAWRDVPGVRNDEWTSRPDVSTLDRLRRQLPGQAMS